MPFKSPRESLLLRVGGEGPGRRDVCVTLTERAWRNRPLQGRVSPEAP